MTSRAAREILLGLADDELLIGHRHSEWLGLAPFLEEDLAFASIAQDELGHARAIYGLIDEGAVDELAFRRSPEEYRCAWLTELPGVPWERALVRHLLYDLAEEVRWRSLRDSSVEGLAEVASKALAEEEYHLRHAIPIVQRMFIGGPEAAARVRRELEALLPMALALFEPPLEETRALEEGVVSVPLGEQQAEWRARLAALLGEVAEQVPWPGTAEGVGARRGKRSPHFAEAMATMLAVFALDPEAERW